MVEAVEASTAPEVLETAIPRRHENHSQAGGRSVMTYLAWHMPPRPLSRSQRHNGKRILRKQEGYQRLLGQNGL